MEALTAVVTPVVDAGMLQGKLLSTDLSFSRDQLPSFSICFVPLFCLPSTSVCVVIEAKETMFAFIVQEPVSCDRHVTHVRGFQNNYDFSIYV